MSYCANPACAEPTSSTNDASTCPSCHASLVLQGRYRCLKLLGQGGFGRTFLAVDESEPSKPRCVVKQLFPQQQHERQRASRLFRQEAQRLRSLEAHSQIPDLIDYFETDEQQYLVQEFIDGTDLAAALKQEKTSSPEEVIALLTSLLPVLEFMHGRKVIHRDIKPANIIRRDRDQRLFLVDLGAAKVSTGTALARTGTTIGSAEYTAPEQLRGKAVFASDIYSLGMTCLHLLTGVSPFNLYNADEGLLVWQDYLKVPIDNHLTQVLSKMTAVATKQRYSSAKEVLKDLRALSTSGSFADQRSVAKPSLIREFKPEHQQTLELKSKEQTRFKESLKAKPVNLKQEWTDAPSLSAEIERQEHLKAGLSQQKLLDIAGNLDWIHDRVVLKILGIFGIPALLLVGIHSVHSNQNSIARGTVSSSANENYREESSLHRTSSWADSSGFQSSASEAFTKGGVYPQPVTAVSLTQEPKQGTTRLLQEHSALSIKTSERKVLHLEISKLSNTLLAVTTQSDDIEKSSRLLIEVWNLESGQKRFELPMQAGFPIVTLSHDGETILAQLLPLSNLDLNNLPDIRAYDARTGNPRQLSSKFDNSILQGAGPDLETGEATVAVESLSSGSRLIAGQETGVALLPTTAVPNGFGAVPQIYGSFFAFGSSPISGGSTTGEVFVLDLNETRSERIIPIAFGYDARPDALRSGDLKFDSTGKLFIGHEAPSCQFSCLEIYEFV